MRREARPLLCIPILRYSARCGSRNWRPPTSCAQPRAFRAAGRLDHRSRRLARLGRPHLGRRGQRVPRLRRRDRLPEPRPRRAAVVRAVHEQVDRYLHQCFMVGIYEPYVAVAQRLDELWPGEQRTKTLLAQFRRRGDRERGEDLAGRNGPRRRRRLRPRFPRPHEPDDGDDLEARLQAGLRPARHRRLPRACAVPVSRRLDGGRAARPRAVLQAGRRPARSRASCSSRSGRRRVHPDAAGVHPRLRDLCDEHGILYVDDEVQAGCGRTGPSGRSSATTSSPTCSCRARRSAAACRSPRSPVARR